MITTKMSKENFIKNLLMQLIGTMLSYHLLSTNGGSRYTELMRDKSAFLQLAVSRNQFD